MPEWLLESGIGETRAILVEHGEICAARVDWDEALRPGLIASAQLIAKSAGARRGIAQFEDGAQVLVDGLPATATEGARLNLRVTRAAIAERGRTKLPNARPATASETPRPAPTLTQELQSGPYPVRTLPITDRRFDDHGWDELIEQALTGDIAFAGGSLIVSPTPAMTLIDIDGSLPLPALALAAIPAIASAMTRLDIGGSVGIDFPTLSDKKDRQAVDAALGAALGPWKGERTAMNGFGFVQLVSRLERPSLVAMMARRPAAAAARALLRHAERVAEPGTLLLTAHPAVRRAIRPEWEADLARRTGRMLRWDEQPALALAAGFAQAITS